MEPIRLPLSCSALLQGMMGRRGTFASLHSPGSQGNSLPNPFPFAAMTKSMEKEYLSPSALCSKMHQCTDMSMC